MPFLILLSNKIFYAEQKYKKKKGKNMEKINSVDSRRFSFFIIDNEVLDNFQLSPLEFTVYSHLVRYAGNKREAYLSNSKLAKDYQKSRRSIINALKVLCEKDLICKKTQSNGNGLNEYIIQNVPKKQQGADPVPPGNTPCSATIHPCSPTEHPPVPPGNTKKTLINNTYINTKKEDAKKIPPSPQAKGIIESLKKILTAWKDSTCQNITPKSIQEAYKRVCLEFGLPEVEQAIKAYILDDWHKNNPSAWDLVKLLKNENREIEKWAGVYKLKYANTKPGKGDYPGNKGDYPDFKTMSLKDVVNYPWFGHVPELEKDGIISRNDVENWKKTGDRKKAKASITDIIKMNWLKFNESVTE